METTTTDCLVLGAGLAGSAYALRLARAGFTVDLLSAGGPFEANTDWAQGGVIFDESPDPSRLRSDILEASDQTANPVAVDQLVREGPDALRELLLDDLQIPFDRNSAGELDRTREGGHAERRIIHTKDATGHAILARVADQVDRTPAIRRHS
ncbi:MAG TPA: FAD-dependent oxidoreductase, partial [Candidatus Didemnitutus sp.]